MEDVALAELAVALDGFEPDEQDLLLAPAVALRLFAVGYQV